MAKGAKTTVCNAGGRTALDEAMHNDRQVRSGVRRRQTVSPSFFHFLFSPLHPRTKRRDTLLLPFQSSRQACVDAIIKASGVEDEEEFDDIEEEGEEAEDMGPETEADK